MKLFVFLLLLIPLQAEAGDLRLHLLDEQLSGHERDSMRSATTGIMVASAAALIAWDIYLATHHKTTESRLLTNVSWKYSTLPLLAGGFCGHLFLNQAKPKNRLWPWGFAIVSGVLAWDLTRRDSKNWTRHPAIWFGVGFGAGALTWGQSAP